MKFRNMATVPMFVLISGKIRSHLMPRQSPSPFLKLPGGEFACQPAHARTPPGSFKKGEGD